jgi:hypothetical protein
VKKAAPNKTAKSIADPKSLLERLAFPARAMPHQAWLLLRTGLWLLVSLESTFQIFDSLFKYERNYLILDYFSQLLSE